MIKKLTERQEAIREHKKLISFISMRIKQVSIIELNRIARILGYGIRW